jgi:hypothetical protein
LMEGAAALITGDLGSQGPCPPVGGGLPAGGDLRHSPRADAQGHLRRGGQGSAERAADYPLGAVKL